MRCFHPITAYKTDNGDVIFHDRNGRDRCLQIRCGQCIGCRISRSEDWAVRCVNEKSLYDSSVFLTLTWDDKKMEALKRSTPISLDHRPFQLFMKRVRKAREVMFVDVEEFASRPGRQWKRHAVCVHRPRMSYYMCGEYGEQLRRPHYHALVFGLEFLDKQVIRTNPFTLWRSAELERLWPFGYSSIGAVTLETAQYVAGYVVDRKTGKDADAHYSVVDVRTGEVTNLAPEYGRMSLRPGIGSRFFERYHSEVSVRDSAVVNGKEYKPPKYYDKKLERLDGFRLDENLFERYKTAQEMQADSTPARLSVQETVVKSRMALKRRLLEL